MTRNRGFKTDFEIVFLRALSGTGDEDAARLCRRSAASMPEPPQLPQPSLQDLLDVLQVADMSNVCFCDFQGCRHSALLWPCAVRLIGSSDFIVASPW